MAPTERDPRYKPESREKAAELYRAGLSTRAVAEQMGLSRTRISELLDEAQVERRPRGRPRKTETAS